MCPKGAGALDYVNSKSRVLYPEYRAPGSDKWERISWKDAIKRISRLLKDDRDANFVEKMQVAKLLTVGQLQVL